MKIKFIKAAFVLGMLCFGTAYADPIEVTGSDWLATCNSGVNYLDNIKVPDNYTVKDIVNYTKCYYYLSGVQDTVALLLSENHDEKEYKKFMRSTYADSPQQVVRGYVLFLKSKPKLLESIGSAPAVIYFMDDAGMSLKLLTTSDNH